MARGCQVAPSPQPLRPSALMGTLAWPTEDTWQTWPRQKPGWNHRFFWMEFYSFYIRFKMDKIDKMSKELMRYFPVSSKVAIDNPPVIDVFPLETSYFHCHVWLPKGSSIWNWVHVSIWNSSRRSNTKQHGPTEWVKRSKIPVKLVDWLMEDRQETSGNHVFFLTLTERRNWMKELPSGKLT
jgi:hypothetical protein